MESKNNLKVGYIYKICNKKTDKIYIGSTVQNLKKRFCKHKTRCKKYFETNKDYITSIEIVKDETSYIEEIEKVYFINKNELLKKEFSYIDKYKNICVNKNKTLKPDKKEYYEKNKEKILKNRKEKYQNRKITNFREKIFNQVCL